MEEIKVSVIVPVYNAEEHLSQCLDTIVNQTLKEIEIICVDDGSTDHSLEILNQYAQKDIRIKVIRQKNQYAGVARNNGLKVAQGEYVIFLDSDDFFKEDLLEKTYNQGKKVGADVVLYGAKRFDTESGEYIEQSHYFHREYAPGEVFSKKDIPDRIFTITSPCPWTKLFRRQFILERNITFQDLQSSNDVCFVLVAMALADRVSYVDEALVYYRIGQTKNLQSIKTKEPTLFLRAYEAVYDRLIDEGVFQEVERSFVNTTVSGCIYNLDSVKTEGARIEIYRELCNHHFSRMGLLEHPLNYYTMPRNAQRLRGAKYIVEWYDHMADKNEEKNFKVVIDHREKNIVPDVSVIVPVYNVAPYLRQCLDSLKKQTLKSIEIICVNDGSTDNSFEILCEYAEQDKRFVVCTQKNSGLSATRNVATKQARGNYLYFMDSDDLLDLAALEELAGEAKRQDLEVLYCDGVCFSESEDCQEQYESNKNYYIRKHHYAGIWRGKDLMAAMLKNEEYRVQVSLQLIKRTYYEHNGLSFYEGIVHEDNIFNYQCMLNAERTGYIPRQFFYRRYRAGSIMTKRVSFANAYGYFCCFLEMERCLTRLNLDDTCKGAALEIMYRVLWGARNSFKQLSAEEKNTIYGLPLHERMLFRLYVSNVCDLKENWEQAKRDKENLNRRLQNEIEAKKSLEANMEAKVKKLEERITGLETSETFMVGKVIMWLPRKIKGFLKI